VTLEFDPSNSKFGIFTEANHPNPLQSAFFPVGTSYLRAPLLIA